MTSTLDPAVSPDGTSRPRITADVDAATLAQCTHVQPAWSCMVRLIVADRTVRDAAARDLTALLDLVDRTASRFRPDSALSRADANAGRPTPVPALLVEFVRVALDAAAVTGGVVDPTVGLAMQRIGYDRDIRAVADSSDPVYALAARASWHDVLLDREADLLTVPPRRHRTALLVEIGGDLAVHGNAPGWNVLVAERAGTPGQLVLVRHGGLATSTTTVRRWTRAGQPMHHIVDPTTGAPTDGPWRTVTVHAQSALAANTA